jgi:hypothetical protein
MRGMLLPLVGIDLPKRAIARVRVERSLPYLFSRPSPVVPELERKGVRNPPRLDSRRSRVQKYTPRPRVIHADAVFHLSSICFLSPLWAGNERKFVALGGFWLALVPHCQIALKPSGPPPSVFNTCRIAMNLPVPSSPSGLRCHI